MYYMSLVLSLVSALFCCVSAVCKTKNKMVSCQLIDSSANAIACLLASSYGGMISSIGAIVRNIVTLKGKATRLFTIVYVLVLICFGIAVSWQSPMSLITVFASAIYSSVICLSKIPYKIDLALGFNVSIWLIHHIYYGLIPSIVGCCFILVSCIIGFIRNYKISMTINKIKRR